MSYFRNFEKVISSKIFTKPNNILFRSNTLPKILCQQLEPSIQHLHTSKYLINTISILKQLQAGSNKQYGKLIEKQLHYLQNAKKAYQGYIKKYVQTGCELTAQSIANAYATAQQMNLSTEWLEQYIHNQIPRKARFMSLMNLNDAINGLKRYHPNSPYIQELQQRKASRPFTQFDYAVRLPNQTFKFQYSGNSPSSNHLISSLRSGRSSQIYWLGKQGCWIWSRILQFFRIPAGYKLHDE